MIFCPLAGRLHTFLFAVVIELNHTRVGFYNEKTTLGGTSKEVSAS